MVFLDHRLFEIGRKITLTRYTCVNRHAKILDAETQPLFTEAPEMLVGYDARGFPAT